MSQATQSKLLLRIPGLVHGFTTKRQSREEVEAQEARTATAKQVHKADLLWVSALEKRQHEADAVATTTPRLPVGVHSADCTPILLVGWEPESGKVNGILAAHGGWRSTAQEIGRKSLQDFAKRVPSAQYSAAIGPCISYESFEVGQEVIDAFPGSLERGLARFLRMEEGRKKYLMNLPGENRRQLEEAAKELGLSLAVEVLDLCTVRLGEDYPSYRRDRGHAGRILSYLEFTR